MRQIQKPEVVIGYHEQTVNLRDTNKTQLGDLYHIEQNLLSGANQRSELVHDNVLNPQKFMHAQQNVLTFVGKPKAVFLNLCETAARQILFS